MRKGVDCDYNKLNISVVMWHRYSVSVGQAMVVTF